MLICIGIDVIGNIPYACTFKLVYQQKIISIYIF